MEATAQKPLRYVVAANVPLQKAKMHDGTIITANATLDLRRKVTKYLLAIDYRPDNFERYFGNAVCEAWPDHVACHACRFIDENAPNEVRKPRDLRLVDVGAFIETVVRWLKEGRFVDDAEARRRANICLQCPHNVEIPGCKSCYNLTGKLAKALNGRDVPNADNLRGCDICGCSLKLKCLVPKEALRRNDHEFPSWCWMNESD